MFKFWAGFIFSIIAVALVSFPVFSEEGKEVSEVEEEDEEIRMWTPAARTMDCTVGANSQANENNPENPHKISVKKLLEKRENYHCTWVEVEGFYRADPYYEFLATIYPSQEKYYELATSFDRRSNVFFIENFSPGNVPHYETQNRSFRFVGLFYDLCLQQEYYIKGLPEYEEGQFIWHFGPCHYSQVYLLKEVKVLEATTPNFQYLTDKNSYEKFGDLLPFNPDFGDLNQIRENALSYMKLLQKGNFESLLNGLRISEEEKEKERESLRKNPTPLMQKFFRGDSNSLASLEVPLETLKVRVFSWGYRGEEGLQYDSDEYAMACFCLDGSCENKWPILAFDTDFPSHLFLCVFLEKHEHKNGEVEWAWWEVKEE